MNNYYIIYKKKKDECASVQYATFLKSGTMLSSNLYDGTKFEDKDLAEEYLNSITKTFKEFKFFILEVDKVIFGNKPMHLRVREE